MGTARKKKASIGNFTPKSILQFQKPSLLNSYLGVDVKQLDFMNSLKKKN